MEIEGLNREEYTWTEEPVIGMVLMNAQKDSLGNPIDVNVFYEVGKHKQTGMLVLIPTGQNAKQDFVNRILKKQGKFN